MLDPRRISDVDQWLDELERLAAAEPSSARFFRQALSDLRRFTQAHGVALLTLSRNSIATVLVSEGICPASVVNEVGQAAARDVTRMVIDRRWLAVPLRNNASTHGWLCLFFESDIAREALQGKLELVRAVAEILAVRQWMRLEQFLDNDWIQFQDFLTTLARSESSDEAAYLLVHGVAAILKAARVSLVECNGVHRRVMAVSNTSEINQHGEIAAALRREASGTALTNPSPASETPNSLVQATGPSLAENLSPYRRSLALSPQVSAERSSKSHAEHVLVVEWSSDDDRFDSEPLVGQFLPSLAPSWNRQLEWLAIPRFFRRWSWLSGPSHGKFRTAMRWGVVVAAVVGLGVLFAWPSPLTIKAQGVLQPTEQRAIFVPMDGFVQEVLVDDGEVVSAEQPLVTLRSHELEREMERIRGALEANRDKREGINVAMNQISSNDRSATETIFSQTRFASELRQLDVEHTGLVAQASMLQAEKEKLTLRSPIQGIVMSHDLRKYLDQRPVKRGDALFRVVNLDSPWRVELQIADRDSGYVTRYYGGSGEAAPIDFTLASSPSEHRTAYVDWISPTAYRHPEHGVVIDVYAGTKATQADPSHVGAAVYANLPCGKQALGFVWSRPLIEALQRNFWW